MIARVVLTVVGLAGVCDGLRMESHAVVLGLNGAFQRRVGFERPVVVGAVNRASSASVGVGGKGQGAFLAAAASGCDAALAQFFGGETGDALARALRSRGAADDALWVRTAAETRVCTTLVGPDGAATEVVEPSGAVSAAELADLEARLATRAPGGAVLVCGSLPPGVPPAFYGACVAAARPARVLVDSVVGLDATVAACARLECAAVLKLNARELLAVAGDPVDAGAADAVRDAPRVARAAAAAAAALDPGRATLEAVLWTDGADPAGLYDPRDGAVAAIALPPLPGPVVSPVGAGDAVAGATFAAWLDDADIRDAFARGLAVGAASCLTPENAAFDAAVAAALRAGMVAPAA